MEACADISRIAARLLNLWTAERPRGLCPFTKATILGIGAILLEATRGADNLTHEESLARARHGLAELLGKID